MRRHKDAVYQVARRNLADSDEALDVVQEVFVAAWRNIKKFDPERPMAAWLFRIAVNACRDRHRRRAVRAFFFRATPLDEPGARNVADVNERTEDRVMARDELRRLAHEIERLPQGAREAFVLNVIEGLSQGEAADALGVTVKAVETRVARARRLLAERLDIDE